jgi:hypothetical protein
MFYRCRNGPTRAHPVCAGTPGGPRQWTTARTMQNRFCQADPSGPTARRKCLSGQDLPKRQAPARTRRFHPQRKNVKQTPSHETQATPDPRKRLCQKELCAECPLANSFQSGRIAPLPRTKRLQKRATHSSHPQTRPNRAPGCTTPSATARPTHSGPVFSALQRVDFFAPRAEFLPRAFLTQAHTFGCSRSRRQSPFSVSHSGAEPGGNAQLYLCGLCASA